MNKRQDAFVERTLAGMSIEDKIGQCMVFELHGTRISPWVRNKIARYRVGGLRATPHVYEGIPYHLRKSTAGDVQRRSAWAGPAEYAQLVNELQDLAMTRGPGIPLIVSMDFEGDFSADFAKGGMHLLPVQMGLTAAGDLALATRAWRILAAQLRGIGVNMLHSPCVDVALRNAAIGARSFADTPEVCARYGLAMMRALAAGGIIPVAKHYAGLARSEVDLHFDTEVNSCPLDELMKLELSPYRKLIRAGLPAIMPSHTAYLALDPAGLPATISRKTVEFTRRAMKFDGVLVTDSVGMEGLVARCDGSIPKAAAEALKAGNDLILVKTTEDEEERVIREVESAVRDGAIAEADLDEHVRRILRLKHGFGLFRRYPVNPARAMAPVRSEANRRTVARLAQKCCTVLRNADGVLPLSPGSRVLCVEPYYPLYQDRGNDFWWHSDMLQEFLSAYSPNVGSHEVINGGTEEDVRAIVAESVNYDVIVVVAQAFRSAPPTRHIADALLAAGRKAVVLACAPYETAIPPAARTVVVTYGMVPPLLRNAAAVLYGRGRAEGKWPLKLTPPPAMKP